MKFIPIFIAFFACAHEPTTIKKAARLKKKKIVSNVEKTINCAQDEAKVFKELVAECKAKFAAEIKRFKQNKCAVPDNSKKKMIRRLKRNNQILLLKIEKLKAKIN